MVLERLKCHAIHQLIRYQPGLPGINQYILFSITIFKLTCSYGEQSSSLHILGLNYFQISSSVSLNSSFGLNKRTHCDFPSPPPPSNLTLQRYQFNFALSTTIKVIASSQILSEEFVSDQINSDEVCLLSQYFQHNQTSIAQSCASTIIQEYSGIIFIISCI